MDSQYELHLLRNPIDISTWLQYARSRQSDIETAHILARAVVEVPDSLEAWQLYVSIRSKHPNQALRSALNKALLIFPSDRSLWDIYISVFPEREVFDRALRHLPPVHHSAIWSKYLGYFPSELARYIEYSPRDVAAVESAELAPAIEVVRRNMHLSFGIWQAVMSKEGCPSWVFQQARGKFPSEDGWIIPKWAETEPNEPEIFVLGLAQASSPQAFRTIWKCLIETCKKYGRSDWLRTIFLPNRQSWLLQLGPCWVPESEDMWIHLADKASSHGRILTLKRAVRRHPQSPRLWIELSRAYFEAAHVLEARTVLHLATRTLRYNLSEKVWLWWSEMEPEKARQILAHAANRLGSGKIWTEYIRVEPGVLAQALKRKTLTMEGAVAVISHNPELWDSVLSQFPWPYVSWLWLKRAQQAGSNIRILRRIYETALMDGVSKDLLEGYASVEAHLGSPALAGHILDRALDVHPTLSLVRQRLHVACGIGAKRRVYTTWIEKLSNNGACLLAQEMAVLETEAGATDRARSLYIWATQFNPPPDFWIEFNRFEQENGTHKTRTSMEELRSRTMEFIKSN